MASNVSSRLIDYPPGQEGNVCALCVLDRQLWLAQLFAPFGIEGHAARAGLCTFIEPGQSDLEDTGKVSGRRIDSKNVLEVHLQQHGLWVDSNFRHPWLPRHDDGLLVEAWPVHGTTATLSFQDLCVGQDVGATNLKDHGQVEEEPRTKQDSKKASTQLHREGCHAWVRDDETHQSTGEHRGEKAGFGRQNITIEDGGLGHLGNLA
mmetsp:Transcript_3751/g.9041  ORF Transcript_3751/g.9041 Transcript_3751/m.9041 type:complete len:206 (-) Transcript_3751:1790-2407(-)